MPTIRPHPPNYTDKEISEQLERAMLKRKIREIVKLIEDNLKIVEDEYS